MTDSTRHATFITRPKRQPVNVVHLGVGESTTGGLLRDCARITCELKVQQHDLEERMQKQHKRTFGMHNSL